MCPKSIHCSHRTACSLARLETNHRLLQSLDRTVRFHQHRCYSTERLVYQQPLHHCSCLDRQYKLEKLRLDRHRFHHHRCLDSMDRFLYRSNQHRHWYWFPPCRASHQRHHRYQQQDQRLALLLDRNRLVSRLVVHHRRNLQDSAD